MEDSEIQRLVAALDTRSTSREEAAWAELKRLGSEVVEHLAAFYPKARTWQGRASLVFHSVRYTRQSGAAFQLGLAALADKSTVVRYRACGLGAHSLRREALPGLRRLVLHKDTRTAEDAAAAMDAIEHQNHHLFVDRTRSGRSFWVVNESDRQQV
ncbi:hypothetical protein O4H66_07165 [Comamonadaceae bacterium G21597-S1]|nr:hypothetical protein [Comamonadaceae bacterium G21597-S1]